MSQVFETSISSIIDACEAEVRKSVKRDLEIDLLRSKRDLLTLARQRCMQILRRPLFSDSISKIYLGADF